MAYSNFTGVSTSYIFDEAGGMRDQLEQTILNELLSKEYPLKATVTTMTASGSGIMGILGATKEQCVVIQIDKEARIVISNTTVGTYLYVEVYLVIEIKGFIATLMANVSAMMDNVFKQQRRNAYYAAAKAATESAFVKLNLKQSNSGYRADSRTITSNNNNNGLR